MTFTLHPQLEADSLFVTDLPLCQVRLNNQSLVPWLVLIPRKDNLREFIDLGASDRALLMEEIAKASHALNSLFKPHKLNIGALGNMVPQLHIHVIARNEGDAAWPKPVWGNLPPSPYGDDAAKKLIEKLQGVLGQ